MKKRAREWGISSAHFDPHASRAALRRSPKPLSEILVPGSTYSRSHLKERLYESGLKQRCCELCGQGEHWRGRRMALIIDHINGVRDDHRLENLRIVCPNCAATLETHCGRKNRRPLTEKPCLHCGGHFLPKYRAQRYCSRYCGTRWDHSQASWRPARKVEERPSYEHLMDLVKEIGYSATGRRYGVSDTAVRKWVQAYERDLAGEHSAAAGTTGRARGARRAA